MNKGKYSANFDSPVQLELFEVSNYRRAPMHNPLFLPTDLSLQTYRLFHADGNSNTARAKRQDLKHIEEFLAHEKLAHLTDVTVDHCRRFQTHLFAKGESPATVARRYRTLKHVFSHFQKIHPLLLNPCRSVKEPRVEQKAPMHLTALELSALREACARISDRNFDRTRARVIVEIGSRCGLRSAEIRSISMKQIKASTFEDVKTKGGKYRQVSFPSSVQCAIDEYLPHREKMLSRSMLYRCLSEEQRQALPLLVARTTVGKTKFHIGEKTLYKIVSDLGELADIPNMHPHRLRHTFVTDFLRFSNDLARTRQAAGHSSVATTTKYLRTEETEIRNTLEKMK